MVIKLKLIDLNDKTATLESDSKEKIVWPKNKLPDKVAVGSVLYFQVSLEEETGKENPELAKEILNEIIGNEE